MKKMTAIHMKSMFAKPIKNVQLNAKFCQSGSKITQCCKSIRRDGFLGIVYHINNEQQNSPRAMSKLRTTLLYIPD